MSLEPAWARTDLNISFQRGTERILRPLSISNLFTLRHQHQRILVYDSCDDNHVGRLHLQTDIAGVDVAV